MSETIFHKIIDRTIPADVVYEDEHLIAFRDIAPQAPVHVLFVPKQDFATLNDLGDSDGGSNTPNSLQNYPVLGSAIATGDTDGATLSVRVTGVSAAQLFYVKVGGADTTAFSTGKYALTLNFGTNPYIFILATAVYFGVFGEIYSLFPATCGDTFGSKYAASNAGLLYTAKGTAAFLVPFASMISASFGWSAVFTLIITLNILAASLAMFVLKPLRRRYLTEEPGAVGAEGLGGVLTTMLIREEDEVKKLLGADDPLVLAGVIALGHPVRQPRRLTRQPVESFTTIDRIDGAQFSPDTR